MAWGYSPPQGKIPHHSAWPTTSSTHASAPLRTLAYACCRSGSPFISHRNMQVFPSPPYITFFLHVPTHAKHRALSLFLFFCATPSFPQVLGLLLSRLSTFAQSQPMGTPLWSHRWEGLWRWCTWLCLCAPRRAEIILGPVRVTWGLCSTKCWHRHTCAFLC